MAHLTYVKRNRSIGTTKGEVGMCFSLKHYSRFRQCIWLNKICVSNGILYQQSRRQDNNIVIFYVLCLSVLKLNLRENQGAIKNGQSIEHIRQNEDKK